MPDPGDSRGPQRHNADLTSIHVGRAIAGDNASLEWVVLRITPLLLVQAEYRLGRALRRLHDPEDIVNDVWAAALPRLGSLIVENGRRVPAFVGYLSTSVLHRVQRLQQRWLQEKRAASRSGEATGAGLAAEIPADATSVVGRSVRNEHCVELRRAIAQLDAKDSEIVILRGIEQHPAAAVAAVLGLNDNAVNVRYHRALRRLIETVRDSVLVDFVDE